MDLHGIVSGAIGAVNPHVPLRIKISTGSVKNDDFTRSAAFAPEITRMGQVQALSYDDIKHMDNLNIQGERRAIYIEGRLDGLVRTQNKGGDLITTPDGLVWLVALVLEYWPDWCKVAVTLQNSP